MKIKVQIISDGKMPLIRREDDYINLFAAEDIVIPGPYSNTLNGKRDKRDVVFSNKLIPLGIRMKLPEGYSAIMVPRGSTYNSFGVMQGNHMGVIDNCFTGESDQWHFNAVAFKDTVIKKGDRICQFRIELNQFATRWQKIKWLFWNGKIEFIRVDGFKGKDRGSFGSTGKR